MNERECEPTETAHHEVFSRTCCSAVNTEHVGRAATSEKLEIDRNWQQRLGSLIVGITLLFIKGVITSVKQSSNCSGLRFDRVQRPSCLVNKTPLIMRPSIADRIKRCILFVCLSCAYEATIHTKLSKAIWWRHNTGHE